MKDVSFHPVFNFFLLHTVQQTSERLAVTTAGSLAGFSAASEAGRRLWTQSQTRVLSSIVLFQFRV